FIRYLNSWKADDAHMPGKQEIYSNTGFFLLSLALQRRFNTPIAKLMEERLTAPLGMSSTVMPVPTANGRGQLAPAFKRRAVQGYNFDAQPVGAPGNQQGPFNWPGTGQLYSSARSSPPISACCQIIVRCRRRWRWRRRACSRSPRALLKRSPGRWCAT